MSEYLFVWSIVGGNDVPLVVRESSHRLARALEASLADFRDPVVTSMSLNVNIDGEIDLVGTETRETSRFTKADGWLDVKTGLHAQEMMGKTDSELVDYDFDRHIRALARARDRALRINPTFDSHDFDARVALGLSRARALHQSQKLSRAEENYRRLRAQIRLMLRVTPNSE